MSYKNKPDSTAALPSALAWGRRAASGRVSPTPKQGYLPKGIETGIKELLRYARKRWDVHPRHNTSFLRARSRLLLHSLTRCYSTIPTLFRDGRDAGYRLLRSSVMAKRLKIHQRKRDNAGFSGIFYHALLISSVVAYTSQHLRNSS